MASPQHAKHDGTIIRVVIQQPALPKYRIPAFRELSRRPGIRLKVVHDNTPGLTNVPQDEFEASLTPSRSCRLWHRTIYWHSPQWRYATPKHADVLILSWNLHYASLIPALLRAKAAGVPTILWGHGYSKQEAGWRRWARENATRLATAVLFYNHTAAQRYINRGWDNNRVFVAINSLDQTSIQDAKRHWSNRPDDLAKFQQEHRLDKGPVVLFVARLSTGRRLDVLISAVALIANEFPTLKVVIIGEGELKDTLLAQARSLGIDGKIQFIGAVYDELKLAPWFLSSNVMCFPSGMGLSIFHAFGYSLPVVTSNNFQSHGPEIEALKDEQNGLLYEDGDAASLAQTLKRVLGDSDLAQRLSDQALQTVTQQFTLRKMIDGVEAAVRYCVEQNTSR